MDSRFREDQPLWVLVSEDSTLLCARHAGEGLLVLSWTTREELKAGVHELFPRAPELFRTHTPQQRSLGALLSTAALLRMRLRIDNWVVEAVETVP